MKCMVVIVALFIFMKICTSESMAASMMLQSAQSNLGMDQELSIQASLTIQTADSTNYYLRAMFFKDGTSSYCGYTWNGSEWFKGPYSSNEGWKKLQKITITNNSWNGELKAKIDPEDSGCKESGVYKLKIQRYNENSGSSTVDEQNEIVLNITVPTQTPTPQPTSKPTPTAKPTPTTKPAATIKPTSVSKIQNSSVQTDNLKSMPTVADLVFREEDEADVLGEATTAGDINNMLKIATGAAYEKSKLGPSVTKKNDDAKGLKSTRKSIMFGVGGILLLFSSCGILVMRKFQDSGEK